MDDVIAAFKEIAAGIEQASSVTTLIGGAGGVQRATASVTNGSGSVATSPVAAAFGDIATGLIQGQGAASQIVESVRAGGEASVGGTILKVLGGGLGLSPIARAIFGLFSGGGGTPEVPPLTKFSLPAPVRMEQAQEGGRVGEAVYGDRGAPRAAVPPVTVQVQAMDSRSFLDHSAEIAQAVREAMLNMNSINDVVTDL